MNERQKRAIESLMVDIKAEVERVKRETTHDGPPFDVLAALEWFHERAVDLVISIGRSEHVPIPQRPMPTLQGAATHRIPEEQIQSAIAWWSGQLLIMENRRALFREHLEQALREKTIGPHSVNLEVDYDPRDLLLEAVRAAGVPCTGSFFSAKNLFRCEKARMSIRPSVTFVSEGYGAPRRVLWGEDPNTSD